MSDIETKLKRYLDDMKERRITLEQKLGFCNAHNLQEEARWIRKEITILCDEYVEIHNKVLGVYF
jgi:hypothetical protein